LYGTSVIRRRVCPLVVYALVRFDQHGRPAVVPVKVGPRLHRTRSPRRAESERLALEVEWRGVEARARVQMPRRRGL
jgi:hypothetical protein